ncbi:MAG: hydrogenase small subunit [Anaerolineales bacterium]|nr:hydrogenase small subunit [Anaerolineales bacterium]
MINIQQVIQDKGISRREFLKFCSVMAGVLALPQVAGARIAQALEGPLKPAVIWLEFQDCAGCSESLLRAPHPTVSELVLDVLSLDYHETIMAASGFLAEEAKEQTIEKGNYLLVVEGSIPAGENAYYCCIGGRSAEDILQEAASGALAVIAVGNCAAFGGLPKASPNPTGAKSVMDLVTDKPVLNLPGCPLNVVNLTAAVVHFLTFGALPEMDSLNRPLFAYGHLIHDNCERRGHFDAGEFVREWGDDGHKKGWCLYRMGCKGPVTYHNCPSVRWNDGTSWPVQSGHGCVGCSEPGFWEFGAYQTTEVFGITPPRTFPAVSQAEVLKVPEGAAGLIGGVIGAAIGIGGVAAYNISTKNQTKDGTEVSEE